MELYDAGVGDIIEIPAHWPRTVTLTRWEHAGIPKSSACIWAGMQGDLCRITWAADSGGHGTTTLSDATVIAMVAKAGPDNSLRKQYEAELEAELATREDDIETACQALLATLGES
jgi:hypothetical protein